jgi:hypothetical protein
MSKLLIQDELLPERVVDVLPKGALEVIPFYSFAYLNSSTGSGVAVSASCLLHSVVITNTAASGAWIVLSDQGVSTDAAPSFPGASASAVAKVYAGVRGKYVYDALINGALCYRLSGGGDSAAGNAGCDGITIMYKLIG